MTSNTRRPGFRLWGGDSADEPGEQAAEQPAEHAPADAVGQADATAPGPQVDAPSAAATPEPMAEPMSEPAPAPEAAGFLSSLVSAMRSVAEEARDGSLADFRASVERRINEVEVDATARGEDLRRQADLDAEAIASWERKEIERIRAESEAKATARREQLDQQLAGHRSTTESRVSAMRAKLADHERALTEFFRELSEIQDPTVFVTMAKRMPRPPLLGEEAADAPVPAWPAEASVEAPVPTRTLEARLAELGVERSAASESTPRAESEGSDAPSDAESSEPDVTAHPAATPAQATASPVAEPMPETAASATAVEPDTQREQQLTDRLAELDSQLAESPAAEAPTGNGMAGAVAAADETSTAIVVKGLGSFGAITSFKQALERVDGIDGVTLSLGPTGEFVYRASHAADFDVIAAVRAVEGPAAQIERADGSVRVTVSRNR